MATRVEDTTLVICKGMTLEIKEVRGTSSCHRPKDGFVETASETQSHFHWRLRGLVSKLGVDVIGTDAFDPKEQEIHDVAFQSHGFDYGYFASFKTREGAIRNALAFAERNGIEVDGYRVDVDAKARKAGR